MLFQKYRSLSRKDRALMDGRLITYHFYVVGVTLLVLGYTGASQGYMFSVAAAFFGAASLVMGAGLNLMHNAFIKGPNRDPYLVTLSAAMGRYAFPLLPALLCTLICFSLFVTILYMVTN